MKDCSGKLIARIKVIVVLILSAVTIFLSGVIERYEDSGDELLENNNFYRQLEGWQITGVGVMMPGDNKSDMQIISEEDGETVAIRQTIENIQGGQAVRLVSSMKTRNVEQGEEKWEAARIIFVGMNEEGNSMYNLPHILVTKNGTIDWEYFSKVFIANSNAVRHYVEIQLVKVKGAMWVKNLSLQPVKETFAFSLFWIVSVLLWIVTTLWLLAPYRHTIFSSKLNVLIIVMLIVVLIATLAPVNLKYNAMESLKLFLPWLDVEGWLFRIGHLLVYCMLSVVVFWAVKSGRQFITRFTLLVLLAMATEIIQYLVDGRTPRVSDFFIDVSGIALGLLISGMFSPYNKIFIKNGMG